VAPIIQSILAGKALFLIKEIAMHAVVRTYSGTGAGQLFDLLEAQKSDVENALRQVSTLQSYTLLRTDEGGMSVTVCLDKAGADESLKVARDWIQKNASKIDAKPPLVTEGTVFIHMNAVAVDV
jgi:hypothetical protein